MPVAPLRLRALISKDDLWTQMCTVRCVFTDDVNNVYSRQEERMMSLRTNGKVTVCWSSCGLTSSQAEQRGLRSSAWCLPQWTFPSW